MENVRRVFDMKTPLALSQPDVRIKRCLQKGECFARKKGIHVLINSDVNRFIFSFFIISGEFNPDSHKTYKAFVKHVPASF